MDDESLENYLTPTQFGSYIGEYIGEEGGVSRAMVQKLLRKTPSYPEGRILGVKKVQIGGVHLNLIPKDARILRAKNFTREGKVTRYIEEWERRHGLREDPPKVDRPWNDGLNDSFLLDSENHGKEE